MGWLALALVLGAWSTTMLRALPTAGWLAGLIALTAALTICIGHRYRFLGCVLLAGAGGFSLAVLTAHGQLSGGLKAENAGHDLLLEGRVTGLPQYGGRRDRFRFELQHASRDGEPIAVPERVRLTWYGPDRPRVRTGDRWRLTARLKERRGFRNPGSFDYERWLFRQGIGATGYVRAVPGPKLLGRATAPLDRMRAGLRQRIEALSADLSHGGILLALTVGERNRIGPAAWETLLATGTNHLVAISGLHVGLVALAGLWLGGLLWRGSGRLMDHLPAPIFRSCLAWALAAVYAALAGFALPTQRALIMLAAALGAVALRRRARAAGALSIAAIAVVLVDPLASMAAGFWLSFGAVAAIVFVAAGRVGRPLRAAGWLRLQLALGLALTPLLVVLFGRASVIAPVANLVAVPWVSLGVVPPALIGAGLAPWWPDAARLAFVLADLVFDPLWRLLQQMEAVPFAQWQRAVPPAWIIGLALLGAFVCLAPRGVPGKLAGLIALLPLLAWAPQRPAPGAVWLDVLDVGQGLSAVVRTRSSTLVYDTGPRFSERFDTGEAVVVPFLRHSGTRRLDTLIVSHGDNDHAGGAPSVRRAYPPTVEWSSVPARVGGAVRFCAAGEGWTADGVRFTFIHPARDAGLLGNNGSCVLRIDAAGGSILLPGDIEAHAEALLVAREADLKADVVLAPHHGSATSSSAMFVRRVQPQWVIYPVGHANRWDFPAPEVMRRWRDAGFARTDCGGALHLRITPDAGVSRPVPWRSRDRRFWHAGCEAPDKSGNMRAVSRRVAATTGGG